MSVGTPRRGPERGPFLAKPAIGVGAIHMPRAKTTFFKFAVAASAVACLAVPCGSVAGVTSVYEQVNTAAEAYLHYSLGRLLETSGFLSEALVQYRRAGRLDPGHCEIDTAVARVLLAMGRVREARSAAEETLDDCEAHELVVVAAAAMIADGDHSAAEALLRDPAGEGAGPDEIVSLLGQALVLQGRTAEALELYRRRAESDTLDAGAAYRHARALLAADRPEMAVVELRRAVRLDPDNRVAKLMLGRLLTAVGETSEAAAILESLLAGPRAGEPEHLAAATAHAMLGNLDRAAEIVTAALESLGESAELLTLLGSVEFDRGNVERSLAAYERVLELTPDSVQALNFVAYTLADLEIDVARSVRLAERAVSLAPEDGLVRDTLGWAYYRAGRFTEAVVEIERAVSLGDSDPVILEHLGDALEAAGRKKEAVDAWREALRLDPDRATAASRIEAALSTLRSEGAEGGETTE